MSGLVGTVVTKMAKEARYGTFFLLQRGIGRWARASALLALFSYRSITTGAVNSP